jgi:hypothetical protein
LFSRLQALTLGDPGNMVNLFCSTNGLSMSFILQSWQLLVLILAGWINREQQEVVEHLQTESQVLKERLGKKRILLSDNQKRRLAVRGKVLGRNMLEEVGRAGDKIECRERLGGMLNYYYRNAE